MHGLSIGKLAKAAKVSIHTIRFYEKGGLLPRPVRRPSGFREYSEADVLHLKFVREADAAANAAVADSNQVLKDSHDKG